MSFSTDSLTQMLAVGYPNFGINFEIDWKIRAQRLLPLIKGLCTYHTDKIDIAIEGEAVTPQNYEQFREYSHNNLKMCIIGNNTITPQDKVNNLRDFTSNNEWTADLDDTQILDLAKELISQSKQLKQSCERFNIQYFDTSSDFLGTINQAKTYLLS